MGEQTGISWCHHTFNPWVGCARISNGPRGACNGCYAAAMMQDRYHRVEFGGPGKGVGTRDRTSVANWRQPLKWDRAAAAAGERRFVFCASLADVFDTDVPFEWFVDLLRLAKRCASLTWLFLTKRIGNAVKLARKALKALGWDSWPKNIAIGATIVTQEEADRDIPKLLAAKFALHPAFVFLSMEPLMGSVDLRKIDAGFGPYVDSLQDGVDWVITGGETDQGAHKARPTHPDWLRAIRDACAEAGVPYHHKQNGEWAQVPVEQVKNGDWFHNFGKGVVVEHIGKKRAGRLLDHVLHDAMPRAA